MKAREDCEMFLVWNTSFNRLLIYFTCKKIQKYRFSETFFKNLKILHTFTLIPSALNDELLLKKQM